MIHQIETIDGGNDGLFPGRWIAQALWIRHDMLAYGSTETEAVEALKAKMREKFPNNQWFPRVPVYNSDQRGGRS
jgi:hypothetical protein